MAETTVIVEVKTPLGVRFVTVPAILEPPKPKPIKIQRARPTNIRLSVEADELLRSHIRRHGDISNIISNLIIEKYGKKEDPKT